LKQIPLISSYFEDSFPDHERIDALTWKPLRLLTFYRAILAGLLLVLFFAIGEISILGQQDPALYTITATLYLGFSLVAGFTARLRHPGYVLQTAMQVLVDIVAITLLTHASGGLSSGLGILLIISVATGSVLLPGRMAFLFAAVAAMAVMGEQFYSSLSVIAPETSDYTQTGLLGIALFATAGLTYLLTRRIYESEALAKRHAISIANLATLNAHIVQRLQAGIIVTDHEHRIRLINEAARKLLNSPAAKVGQPLNTLSPALFHLLQDWRKAPDREPTLLETGPANPKVLPQFTLLGTTDGIGSLIFLEDTATMEKQAQQNKLASLGRLTASIAHEIRNPLGAISHASQLLNESEVLSAEDQRLMTIISDHTRRVNTVVKNVLHLSRPDTSIPQRIELKTWLKDFVDEFTLSGNCDARQVSFSASPGDIAVYMDPSLLHQVIWNLCQNAVQHSTQEQEAIRIKLIAGRSDTTRVPTLDIIDNGSGIADDLSDTIFEPFFTTKSSGTGLGLYIAREICESSNAHLNYLPLPGEGSCFRITFPDTEGLSVSAFA
jgi:two-component system sensor histidine kinase PilS (NtrC family)